MYACIILITLLKIPKMEIMNAKYRNTNNRQILHIQKHNLFNDFILNSVECRLQPVWNTNNTDFITVKNWRKLIILHKESK